MYFENNDNNENIERILIYIMIYFSISTFDTTSISKFIRNNYYKKRGHGFKAGFIYHLSIKQ